jgi:hypothetical protein
MIDADVTELIARVPLPAWGGHARGRPPGARAHLPRGQWACKGASPRARLGKPARALPRAAGKHPSARLPHDAGT